MYINHTIYSYLGQYKKRGWKAFPVKPNTKEAKVKWRENKDYYKFIKEGDNVAVETGKVSGITVIDIDNYELGERIIDYFKLNGVYRVNTIKGIHLYFNFTDKLRTGSICFGDIKNEGGYVLVPPSTINETQYTLIGGEIKNIPEQFFDFLKLFRNASNFLKGKLEVIPEGNRNNTLTQLVGSIINIDNLTLYEKLQLLKYINTFYCEPPLLDREVETIFKSIKSKTVDLVKAPPPGKSPEHRKTKKKENEKPQLVELVKEWIVKNKLTDYFIYNPLFDCFMKYNEITDNWNFENAETELNFVIWKFIENDKYTFRGTANDLVRIKDILRTIPEFSLNQLRGVGGIPCKNGIINLPLAEFREVDNYKGIPCINKVNHEFFWDCCIKQAKLFNGGSAFVTSDFVSEINRVAQDTLFYEFLKTSIGGYEEIEFLQKALGSTLDEKKKDVSVYFLYGESGSGKSTLINIIQKVLGERVDCLSNEFLKQRSTVNREYYKAQLVGKNIIYTEELTKTLESALIKELMSGNKVQARNPGGKPFTFIPNFSLFILCNNLPDMDEIEGITRRVKAIRFKKGYTRQIYNLSDEIVNKEGDIIFNWLIAGYYKAMDDYKNYGEIKETEAMEADKKEWIYTVEGDFNDWWSEYVEIDPDNWESVPELYNHFKQVTKTDWSKKKFSQKLNQLGYRIVINPVVNMKGRCIKGVKLIKKDTLFKN